MRYAYMVATSEVSEPRVTAWRGELGQAFRAVSQAGFAGVELMICDPGAQDAAQLAGLAEACQLEIPVLCTGEIYGQDGLSLSDPDASIRSRAVERLKAMVELASELGAHVNVGRLRGKYVRSVPAERTLDWIRQGLMEGASVNPEVRLLLEPINRSVTNCIHTTAEGLAFIRDLGIPNVNLMLDTMHMEAEEEDLAESFSRAAEQCYHVHIGQKDRLAPGTGSYDLGPVIQSLRSIRYEHWVGVEVWQEPDQETALRRSAAALTKFR